MKAVPKPWIILNLQQFKDKIDFNPPYQRKPNKWTLPKKQRLIDSILREYDLPKFYIAESPRDGFEWEIVDGQQRIRAIIDFMHDGFTLDDEADDINELPDISGLKYSELPTEAQERIGMFELSITLLMDTDRQELEDLFRRLQEGVRITPTEYRNAMNCEIRDFVVELTEINVHPVFQNIRLSNEKWLWRELLDIIVCLELNGNPTDVKARELRDMYEIGKFTKGKKTREKIRRVLNYYSRVAKIDSSLMDKKWGFIDLYWLISSLIDRYDLNDMQGEFASFYKVFEGERRKALKEDQKNLAAGNYQQRHLFDYQAAFEKSAGTKKNITTRATIYRSWFLRQLADHGIELTIRDTQRSFDHDDRIVVWYMAGGVCQSCGKDLEISEMEADHIKPHSRGGLTVLSNAQCLCIDCNRRKSSKH
jgi:5-methylcytosine-specific restriction endonuclease McrA